MTEGAQVGTDTAAPLEVSAADTMAGGPNRAGQREALRLDLACGKRCAPGFAGVDQDKSLPGVRYVSDLELTPWVLREVENAQLGAAYTLGDASVDALHCSHFVEHVSDLVAFMNECHRVLVPDGVMTIRHPYQFSVCAWQDPTHVRALNEVSWYYFDADFRAVNELEHYLGITADFEVHEVIPSQVHPDYQSHTPEAFHRAMRQKVNVVHELTVTLLKK